MTARTPFWRMLASSIGVTRLGTASWSRGRAVQRGPALAKASEGFCGQHRAPKLCLAPELRDALNRYLEGSIFVRIDSKAFVAKRVRLGQRSHRSIVSSRRLPERAANQTLLAAKLGPSRKS